MVKKMDNRSFAQRAKAEAEKEFNKETFDAAKQIIKSKMGEIRRAEKVLKNLERELEDLMFDLERNE